MNTSLCVYEDYKVTNLYPLTLTRAAYELRCGMFSLLQKMVRYFPGSRVGYSVRKEILGLIEEKHRGAVINKLPQAAGYFLNARLILLEPPPANLKKSTAFRCAGQFVGAFVTRADLKLITLTDNGLLDDTVFESFPTMEIKGVVINYPWDLVNHCAEEIIHDFNFMGSGGQILGKVYPNVTLLSQENIYLAAGSEVHSGAVIDGEAGPVYISEGAVIMANAVIQGPAFVGPQSRIKIGAKIYEGTSIGEVCKVGGEVEESILHGFANKQHEGFLGHAYLGEWTNLGADTNNSDLKNNYRPVKVMINGEMVDSGSMFVGLFMGDHSKSGINTMFNTGTVVGVMCNVYGAGYSPKFIPSFTWGGIEASERYDIEKALDTARRVMARRKRDMTPAQERNLREIYDASRTKPI